MEASETSKLWQEIDNHCVPIGGLFCATVRRNLLPSILQRYLDPLTKAQLSEDIYVPLKVEDIARVKMKKLSLLAEWKKSNCQNIKFINVFITLLLEM